MNVVLAVLLSTGLAAGVIHNCPNDCNWNGRCNTSTGKCTCYDGFGKSDDCSIDCGCNGHGKCKSDNTCQCDDGWKWSVVERKCIWDCQCVSGVRCIGPGICDCQHTCIYGTCWNGQCECWEGYYGSTCSHFNINMMANKNSSIGINLGGITYYSSEIKFVDVAKQSQSWITERKEGPLAHTWDTHEQSTVQWRDDGYPASLPGTMLIGKLMLRNSEHSPAGNYTILYDGEGEIDIHLVRTHVFYDGKGRMVVGMSPGKGGIMLRLLRTNPRNPLRNLRVILPGFEDRYERFPFYPVFLETLRRYSEIRFMDFLHTNGHTPEPTVWRSRKLKDYHTQAGSDGGAIEYMIHASNILGGSPWFNMPHAADDNYIKQFATLVKSSLRPDLKVYVEYSNEVWNGIFRQTKYTQEQGKQLSLDPAAYRAGMKYYNKRSTEVMDLWSAVYGSESSRLVPVWAWQTGYQDYTRQAITDLGHRTSSFKAIAITGYFGCDGIAGKHKNQFPNMTFAEISQYCKNDMPKIESSYRHYMEVAKNHSLKLLMYEGGPGIVESGAIAHGVSHEEITYQAISFNRHDLMEAAVTDVLEAWFTVVNSDPYNTAPGGLFNYFSSCGLPSKYGSWGMIEYTGQDLLSVPKYRAVQKFITRHSGNTYLDTKCSFVKTGSILYGCIMEHANSKCGVSDDGGVTWNYFPSLHSNGTVSVLDGYNTVTGTLFVRTVDSMSVNYYYTYDAKHSYSFKKLTNFFYHDQLANRNVIRRMTNGVYPRNGFISDCL